MIQITNQDKIKKRFYDGICTTTGKNKEYFWSKNKGKCMDHPCVEKLSFMKGKLIIAINYTKKI